MSLNRLLDKTGERAQTSLPQCRNQAKISEGNTNNTIEDVLYGSTLEADRPIKTSHGNSRADPEPQRS